MKKLKYIFLIISIVLLCIGLFFLLQKEENELNQWIAEDLEKLEALPLSYTLEDAIHDGYYYEENPIDKLSNSMIRFLSYNNSKHIVTLRIATKEDTSIVLRTIFCKNRKFVMLNYRLNKETRERNWDRVEYNYMIVPIHREKQVYSYYLTNDKNLYEEVKASPENDYSMESLDAIYLFSRSYTPK